MSATPGLVAAGGSWARVATAATSSDPVDLLAAVDCTGASWCMAVGDAQHAGVFTPYGSSKGRPLSQVWDGRTWRAVTPPVPAGTSASGLLGVSCLSPTDCRAVGFKRNDGANADLPLIERWDGTSWIIQTAPVLGAKTVGGVLSAVSCSTSTDCTAVGFIFSSGYEHPLAVATDGTWRVEDVAPTSGTAYFDGVSCLRVGVCLAIGSYTVSPFDRPLGEYRNGRTWTLATPREATGAAGADPTSVSCASTACGVSVLGYDGTARSHVDKGDLDIFDGETYRRITVPLPAKGYADSLSCPTITDCTLTGGTGSGSALLADHWNGSTVAGEDIGQGPAGRVDQLDAVSCLSGSACVAVGLSTPSTAGTTGSAFSEVRS